MRIVYFGCDPFIGCLEQLLADGHEITALFTFHNTHDWYNEERITRLAGEHNIPVRYDRITMAEADRLFEDRKCDAFLSAEYNWLIPVPARHDFRGVNIHNMLLPESPGFFPIETQLFLRRGYGGVSLHKMTPVFDEGDILFSERYALSQDDTVENAYALCADIARRAVGMVFADFESAWRDAKPQTGKCLTQSPGVRQRTITPETPVSEALHLWRCFKTYSYTSVDGVSYRILDMSSVEDDADTGWLSADTVVFKLKEGAVCLRVEEK